MVFYLRPHRKIFVEYFIHLINIFWQLVRGFRIITIIILISFDCLKLGRTVKGPFKNYVIFWGGGHQKITFDYRGEVKGAPKRIT